MVFNRSISLIAAFGALLVISCGAAWAIWSNTQSAQDSAARLHRRDLTIQAALDEVRSNVFLSAILARDFLLEDAPSNVDYAQQFTALHARTEASLRTLSEQNISDELQSPVRQLTTELEEYARSNDLLVSWTPRQRMELRENALRQRVGRRRDILALTDRIATVSAESSSRQRTLSQAGDRTFRVSLAWIAGIALLLGAGVAGFAVHRMRVLEELSVSAEAELRSLSGQLRTTQEQERRRLSRELHDQVGQMLTGLRMELAAIARAPAAADPQVHAAVERAKETAEQTLSVVRNIAMLLRPSMLDDLGLTPALTWLAREVERSSGMEIRREIDVRVDGLPDAHRTCIFRVVQEALTNAARHSGGGRVELQVKWAAGTVRVRVADDGRGFEPVHRKGKGLGLLGIEERVRELGGQFHISSVPGGGAAVEIWLLEPASLEETSDAEDNRDDRGRPRNRENRATAAF